MFARFFVDRPIFATVLSLVIVIVGLVALTRLPIAQYPEVAPPTIQVSATYPGADAETVATTVATPIEQEVNGVERMLYMASRCTNDGQMFLDVTFELGTDLDTAQVLVQNRVSVAEAKLPEDVKRIGVTTKKKSPSILLCVNLVSDKKPDGSFLLRPALPEQLRLAQREGRPGARQGRGRRDVPRPARLQHARLARSAEARVAGHDGRRRDQGHPRAERPGRRRPARAAAGRRGRGRAVSTGRSRPRDA